MGREEIIIREARPSDIDLLTEMRMALLREMGNIASDADAAALAGAVRNYFMEKLPGGRFLAWLAGTDGLVVGTSGLVHLEKPPLVGNLSGREGYVMNMYTLPAWRRKGIAGALLDTVIGYERGSGVKRIWLHATPPGETVYRKAGFTPVGEKNPSRVNVEMELIFTKTR
jgi:GNAT superfamily N-acetyltransferase